MSRCFSIVDMLKVLPFSSELFSSSWIKILESRYPFRIPKLGQIKQFSASFLHVKANHNFLIEVYRGTEMVQGLRRVFSNFSYQYTLKDTMESSSISARQSFSSWVTARESLNSQRINRKLFRHQYIRPFILTVHKENIFARPDQDTRQLVSSQFNTAPSFLRTRLETSPWIYHQSS